MNETPSGILKTLVESVRFAMLLVILSYGTLIAFLSQTSSPNYRALEASVSNQLVFYLLAAAFHLWISRMKGWKILVPATVIVAAFVGELFMRIAGI